MTWWNVNRLPTGQTVIAIHGELGAFCAGADGLVEEIDGVGDLELSIDSPGGDGATGLAVFDALRERTSLATVTGACCSAAILPLLAAKRRVTFPNAHFLLHAPTAACLGNPGELREAADRLEAQQSMLAQIISERTGQAKSTVAEWLHGPDHYFNAQEALAAGLVDEIIEAPSVLPSPRYAAPGTPPTTESEQLLFDLLGALGTIETSNKARLLRNLSAWAGYGVRETTGKVEV